MNKSLPKILLTVLVAIAGIESTSAKANGRYRKLFSASMERRGACIGALSGSVAGFVGSFLLVDQTIKFNSKEKMYVLPEKRPVTFLTALTVGTGTGFVTGAATGIGCGIAANHVWTATKAAVEKTISPATRQLLRQRSMPVIAGAGICLLANQIYKENKK